MRRFGLVALCALGISGFASSAQAENAQRTSTQSSAGDQCISPDARTRATSCEVGGRNPRIRRSGNAPVSHVQAVERTTDAADQTTRPGFQIDLATEAGIRATEQRARGLLEREVEILKRLVRNTRTNNPQRPEILLRLAETYFEMQHAVNAEARALDEK